MHVFSRWTAERAAESKLQKAGPVIDSRLGSVPEVPVGVASEPKATQTAPLSPTSPTPSNKEQVQNVQCCVLPRHDAKLQLASVLGVTSVTVFVFFIA